MWRGVQKTSCSFGGCGAGEGDSHITRPDLPGSVPPSPVQAHKDGVPLLSDSLCLIFIHVNAG